MFFAATLAAKPYQNLDQAARTSEIPAADEGELKQMKCGTGMSKAVKAGDVLGNAVQHGPICGHLRLKNLPLRCKLAAVILNQAITPTDTPA
jgi:hypothetical protein